MDMNGNIIKEIKYTNGKVDLESHVVRNNKIIIEFQKKNGNTETLHFNVPKTDRISGQH